MCEGPRLLHPFASEICGTFAELVSFDHLVAISRGWSSWKWVLVRGAGFPARNILGLASGDLARAADALDAARDALRGAQQSAIEQLTALHGTASSKVVAKTIRAVERGELPAQLAELPAHAAFDALRTAHAACRQQSDAVDALFDSEQQRIAEVLRAMGRDPRFREALTWQNRHALHTGVDWVLQNPTAHNAGARAKYQTIASYIQRYCVKNDTIGFFGPVGWATLHPDDARVTVRAGAELLDKRTVYFEHWCIDALAQTFARDPELRPFMRPRRLPTVRVEGADVVYPVGKRATLPLAYARLLASADGVTTARAIAKVLVADPELGLADEAEVFGLLDDLVAKRFCTWTLEIPTVTEWPERHLRELLEAAEGDVRRRALAALDRLEDKRHAVAAAAGDHRALDRALCDLDSTFKELTAQDAQRRGGEMYAGRTLVFEDCRRNVTIDLGERALAQLMPALSLLLTSARWYTHQIAEQYRERLTAAFDGAGGAPMDYLAFWRDAKALFPEGERSPVIAACAAELQRRWTALLRYDSTARRLDLTSRELAAGVAESFAAPHPGWPGARYHSPDVMIAAASVEQLRAVDCLFVLGEMHPSVSTMHFAVTKEHDDRAALIRARELDLERTIPWPVNAKESASRADHMWVSAHDVDVELGTTISWRPRAHVLGLADLVVERDARGVRARDRAGRYDFDIVELFGAFLNGSIHTSFDITPGDAHVPRITIDRVVVTREQWRPDVRTIPFATMERGAQQFVAARRWARELGMPRWVFVRVPEEPKPTFVDFESPIYVDMVAKTLRKASRATFSEMLPTPEQTWLPDHEGRTYTCELRFVAVDDLTWQPPQRT